VKQSELMPERLGLFSCRDYPKGSVLGCFCGSERYEYEEAGGAKPVELYIEEDGILEFRMTNGCWHGIQPERLAYNDGKSVDVVVVRRYEAALIALSVGFNRGERC
jgi:hypothetical protein